jgi:TonB family protein
MVLGIANTRVAEEARDAEWDGWRPPKPPRFTLPTESFYPLEAMRNGVEGRVLVAFDITPGGTATNTSILWTENSSLAGAARHMLSAGHFDVPVEWANSGALQRW